MQESSLHAALKNLYTLPGAAQEVPVDGYLVDVVRGELLIEIQTGNFTHLKLKLPDLLERHPVLLVYPIAREKWIVRLPLEEGDPVERRKSPYRGRLEHLFRELVRIPQLVLHPNFALDVLLIQEEELRRNDGRGSWRRKGWSIVDRRLISVVEKVTLRSTRDFLRFLPGDLPEPTFSMRQYAAALKIPPYLASKTLYCLRQMGLVEVAEKKGRAYRYARLCQPENKKDL